MGQNICIPSIFQINQAVTAGADIDDLALKATTVSNVINITVAVWWFNQSATISDTVTNKYSYIRHSTYLNY